MNEATAPPASPAEAPAYIRVSKIIKAPREKVYQAWLEPETRMKWWGAAPEYRCTQCTIDAKVGGQYRINMVKQDHEYVTIGQFVELQPPHKLAFTWSWESPADGVKDTFVTVELFEVQVDGQAATELVLTHMQLSDPVQRAHHNDGWAGCLQSLGKFFE